MEHLIFASDATVPTPCLVLLGVVFRMTGILNRDFADRIDHFVFNVSLPAVLWRDLPGADLLKVWDGKFVGLCLMATTASILTAATASILLKKKEIRGEFIQASYHSNAALLGITLVQNICGNSGMAPLTIVGCVSPHNIMVVVTLEMTRPGRGRINKGLLIKASVGTLHNPTLWGIICGMVWSASGILRPAALVGVIGGVATLTMPLGPLAMGVFSGPGWAGKSIGPVLLASFIKLAGLEFIIIPTVIAAGFRREALAVIFIILSLVITFGAFVMTKNMGYGNDLISSTVMITIYGCVVTPTIGLYILKSLNPA